VPDREGFGVRCRRIVDIKPNLVLPLRSHETLPLRCAPPIYSNPVWRQNELSSPKTQQSLGPDPTAVLGRRAWRVLPSCPAAPFDPKSNARRRPGSPWPSSTGSL